MKKGTDLLSIEQIIGINDNENFKKCTRLQLRKIMQRLHQLNNSNLVPKDYLLLNETHHALSIALEVIECFSSVPDKDIASGPADSEFFSRSNIP